MANSAISITVGSVQLVPDPSLYSINGGSLSNGTVFKFEDMNDIFWRNDPGDPKTIKYFNFSTTTQDGASLDDVRCSHQGSAYEWYTELDDSVESVWYMTQAMSRHWDEILLNNSDESTPHWNNSHTSVDGWVVRDIEVSEGSARKIVVEKVLSDSMKMYLNDQAIDSGQTLLTHVRDTKGDVFACFHAGDLPELDRKYWVLTEGGIDEAASWDAKCAEYRHQSNQNHGYDVDEYIKVVQIDDPDAPGTNVPVHISAHEARGDSLAHGHFLNIDTVLHLMEQNEDITVQARQFIITDSVLINNMQLGWENFVLAMKDFKKDTYDASHAVDTSTVVDMATYVVYEATLDAIFAAPFPSNILADYWVLAEQSLAITIDTTLSIEQRDAELEILKEGKTEREIKEINFGVKSGLQKVHDKYMCDMDIRGMGIIQ